MVHRSAREHDLKSIRLGDPHEIPMQVSHLLESETTALLRAEHDVEETIGVGVAAHLSRRAATLSILLRFSPGFARG